MDLPNPAQIHTMPSLHHPCALPNVDPISPPFSNKPSSSAMDPSTATSPNDRCWAIAATAYCLPLIRRLPQDDRRSANHSTIASSLVDAGPARGRREEPLVAPLVVAAAYMDC
ncbi:hypothetical protein VPH35_008939 [Triticum aestivum]